MSEPVRWYAREGDEWRLRFRGMAAYIWLADDNLTYKSTIFWTDGTIILANEYDCLKKAKSGCLEIITRLQQEHLDDTA